MNFSNPFVVKASHMLHGSQLSLVQSFSSFNPPPPRQQLEKIREIALVLEEWAPEDENVIYAEEDAVGEFTAAADEANIPPSI